MNILGAEDVGSGFGMNVETEYAEDWGDEEPAPYDEPPEQARKNSNCRLILGDCLEKLKGLPAESVDLIASDPPYQLGSIKKRYGEIKNYQKGE